MIEHVVDNLFLCRNFVGQSSPEQGRGRIGVRVRVVCWDAGGIMLSGK